MSRIAKSIETESRLVVARTCKESKNGYGLSVWVDENIQVLVTQLCEYTQNHQIQC